MRVILLKASTVLSEVQAYFPPVFVIGWQRLVLIIIMRCFSPTLKRLMARERILVMQSGTARQVHTYILMLSAWENYAKK